MRAQRPFMTFSNLAAPPDTVAIGSRNRALHQAVASTNDDQNRKSQAAKLRRRRPAKRESMQ